MPISNATQNAILALTFQAVAWANYADNAASSPQTSTQIGLNTADPTTAGTGGSGTASFFSTGKTGGGAAAILWSGTVTPNIVCGSGVTPQLSTATAITLD